jgi:hypothetical protein
VVDWPSPPLIEPHGPLGDDEEVVRAYARDQLAPYSARFHVEGPVLLADRDVAVALRLGERSFLVNRELHGDLAAAKEITESVFSAEGMTMLDEETLYGPAVGVQQVGLRYTSWDLWGADIDKAFADLRVAAAGGREDILFGGGDFPAMPG